MTAVARAVALLVLTIAAFIVYVYASAYIERNVFPDTSAHTYFERVTIAIAGGGATSALCAYPLSRMFSRRAWVAGLILASPVAFLRVADVLLYADDDGSRVVAMSWVELLIYPATIVAGVWVTSRRRSQRPTSAA
jgi:hypothetical protein